MAFFVYSLCFSMFFSPSLFGFLSDFLFFFFADIELSATFAHKLSNVSHEKQIACVRMYIVSLSVSCRLY